MAPTAAYDQIADWYEHEFLRRQQATDGMPGADPVGVDRTLRDLLGPGSGTCLELGCGTGVHAASVRELGWTPVGVDLSTGMLSYARGRLPAAQADAERLPVRDGSMPAVIAVMVHTDMPGCPAVLAEAARVLRPGGLLVHVGVHPCFNGSFVDRSDPDAVVIRPGYLDSYWTKASWTDQGVRDKVGATHRPLPEFLHAFLDAGLTLERFAEGGAPTPMCWPSGRGNHGDTVTGDPKPRLRLASQALSTCQRAGSASDRSSRKACQSTRQTVRGLCHQIGGHDRTILITARAPDLPQAYLRPAGPRPHRPLRSPHQSLNTDEAGTQSTTRGWRQWHPSTQ